MINSYLEDACTLARTADFDYHDRGMPLALKYACLWMYNTLGDTELMVPNYLESTRNYDGQGW